MSGGPEVPEGVFDMVRAVCIIASVTAFLDTSRVASRGLMQDPCPTCHGNGRMTCERCQGTKSIAVRPARFMRKRSRRNKQRFLRRDEDMDECWECGDYTKYDFDLNSEDINSDVDAAMIRQNFTCALAGKRTPLQFSCTAGMVVCKTCMGSKVAYRSLPNFARLFGRTPSLFEEWAGQDGIQTYKDSNTTLFKPRKVATFAEYREHPRPPSWRETCRPIVHVHAILCNEVAKNKKDLSAVDEDKIVSPFRFRLPGLDGSNVTGQNRKAMGHPLAFP